MKRLIIISFIVLLSQAIFPSCLNGAKPIKASRNYVTKQLPVPGDIEVIDLTGNADIEYFAATGGQASLSVYGSDNVIDLLEVSVSGNILTVKYRDGVNGINNSGVPASERITIQGDPEMKVTVVAPGMLEKINITGSGDVKLMGAVEGDNLELKVSGSGDIEAQRLEYREMSIDVTGSGDIDAEWVVAEQVTVNVVGSGDVELAGTTSRAQYNVTGSGDIDAAKLQAEYVTAKISGSGDISCHASESFDAAVYGSGGIRYKGDPGTVKINGTKDSVRPM